MRLFLILSLALSIHAHAQREVSSGTFQANVRPALSGIVSDFYQMIVNFPHFPKEMGSLMNQLNDMAEAKTNLLSECPGLISKKCEASLKSIQKSLQNIDTKVHELLGRLQFNQTLHIDTMAGLRILNSVEAQLDVLKGQVDNSLLKIKAGVPIRDTTYPIVRKLDELTDLTSLATVEFIPYLYKEDFRHFCFNFVFPVQREMSKVKSWVYMNKNVAYLNFSLNLLNMNLTKRNKKTPEGMGSYLSTIHNRWNGIMRMYY